MTLEKTANEFHVEGEMDEIVLCPNCHTELRGLFCGGCGQSQRRTDRFLFTLVAESFEDVFSFDSRTAKTLFRLLFKPGALTKEYFRGRRARYVQPLRLYFISSIAFFFLLSLQTVINSSEIDLVNNNETVEAQRTEIIEEKPDELTAEDKEEIKNGIDELSSILYPFFLPEKGKINFSKKMKSQFEKTYNMAKESPQDFFGIFLDLAPPVIFVLLPLFAFLLKIVYINTGRYYTEHLILAVHNHCFIYISLFISGLLKFLPSHIITETLKAIVLIWIPVYLFLSLKNTYGEGWLSTIIKYIVLGVSYSIMFGIVSFFALIIGILTL